MSPSPYLRVPKPPARPGEAPDFSYVSLSPAGATPRPVPSASLTDTAALTSGLVRVLDDTHKAVGPWNPELDADTLRERGIISHGS